MEKQKKEGYDPKTFPTKYSEYVVFAADLPETESAIFIEAGIREMSQYLFNGRRITEEQAKVLGVGKSTKKVTEVKISVRKPRKTKDGEIEYYAKSPYIFISREDILTLSKLLVKADPYIQEVYPTA